jgi:hypothetical protein
LLSIAVMRSAIRIPIPICARVRVLFSLTSLACLACGCATGSTGFAFENDAAASDDGSIVIASPSEDATVSSTSEDAGSFPGTLIDDASPASDDGASIEDSPTGPPFDAGEGGLCTHPLAAGDLTIVEMMIESTPGTGDHGEWIEVMSTLDCAIDLAGLQGECPAGAKVNTFEIDSDLWIPPMGTFVIADSTNPAVNHDLPVPVVSWTGEPGDVLRNEGATVTLLQGNTIIDSVTYPNLKLVAGTSTAFPSDCARELRSEWSSWQPSTSSWFPELRGTPNAPNTDVRCASEPDD